MEVRVLARVPTPQLHENYNGVLQEEFASVSQTLGAAVAAYAKLEEVHDAVSKLQPSHDSSTGGRSDSLKASAEGIMLLQRLLQRQVDKLAVGMEVAQDDRKRKREDEQTPTAPSAHHSKGLSGGNVVDMAPCNAATHKARRLEKDADSDAESPEEEMDTSPQKSKVKKSVAMERAVAAASRSASSSSSESESGDDSDEVEGSEAAWMALTTKGELSDPSPGRMSVPGPANDAEKFESGATKPLRKMATYMKTVVEIVSTFSPLDRSFITSEVLAALKESVEEDVDGMQQSEVTTSLKLVVSWGDRHKGYQVEHVDAYREYAAVVKSYVARLPSSAQISELERLKRALFTMINSIEGRFVRKEVAAAVQDAKRRSLFSVVMGEGNSVPHEKRLETVLRMLVAFKQETACDVSSSFGDRMNKVISRVSRWLNEDFHDPVHLLVHRIIVDGFRGCSNRIPKVSMRDRVVRRLAVMSEGISDPNSARNRNRLSKLRDQATQVLREVEQYQRKPISASEAHRLMESARSLVQDVTVGWIPHRDMTICTCVQKLKSVLVHAQTPGDENAKKSFKACILIMTRWKVEDPPAVEQAGIKRKRVQDQVVSVPTGVTPAHRKGGDAVSCSAVTKKAKVGEDAGPDSDGSMRLRSQNEKKCESSVVEQELAVASDSESSSSTESESGDENDESDGTGEEGSESAWKALPRTGTGGSLAPTGTLETRSEMEEATIRDGADGNSITYMKTIVEEISNMSPVDRSFIIPDVLAALKDAVEEDIDDSHLSNVAACFKMLVSWWIRQRQDQIPHAESYREFAAAVTKCASRLPKSKQTSELRSLVNTQLAMIKNIGRRSQRNTRECDTTRQSAFVFSSAVGAHDIQLSTHPDKLRKRFIRVLVAFKKELASGIKDHSARRIFKPLSIVLRQICECPRDPLLICIYRMLVRGAQACLPQIADAATRDSLHGLLERVSEGIENPTSHKTRKFLADIRSSAVGVLREVQRWEGETISKAEVERQVKAVEDVINYVTLGWDPRQESTIRQCVKKLKGIIERCTDGDLGRRQMILQRIARWKVNDP